MKNKNIFLISFLFLLLISTIGVFANPFGLVDNTINENNVCTTEKNNFKIVTTPCTAEYKKNIPITQQLELTWNGQNTINTDWYFVYDGTLSYGKVLLIDENSVEYTYKDENNITRTAYNYSRNEIDITNQFNFAGTGLYDSKNMKYYKVSNTQFTSGKTYKLKWLYESTEKESSGKWHIFGKLTLDSLSSAVSANRYIYQDPYWELYNASTYSYLQNQIISYYTADESAAPLKDLILNYTTSAHTGTPSYGNTTQFKINKSIYFDDASSIALNNSPTYNFSTNNFSVCVWTYPTDSSYNGILGSTTATGAANGFLMEYRTSPLRPTFECANGGSIQDSVNTFAANQWIFYCFTRNGTTGNIYTNGVYRVTGNCNNSVNSVQPFILGCSTHSCGSFETYKGYIDEISFWNGTLNDSSITYLYNLGSPNINQQPPYSNRVLNNTYLIGNYLYYDQLWINDSLSNRATITSNTLNNNLSITNGYAEYISKSFNITSPLNITNVTLSTTGTNLINTNLYLSLDNGTHYLDIPMNSTTFAWNYPISNQLKYSIRILNNSATTQIQYMKLTFNDNNVVQNFTEPIPTANADANISNVTIQGYCQGVDYIDTNFNLTYRWIKNGATYSMGTYTVTNYLGEKINVNNLTNLQETGTFDLYCSINNGVENTVSQSILMNEIVIKTYIDNTSLSNYILKNKNTSLSYNVTSTSFYTPLLNSTYSFNVTKTNYGTTNFIVNASQFITYVYLSPSLTFNFKDEMTGGNFNISGTSSLTLDLFCDTFKTTSTITTIQKNLTINCSFDRLRVNVAYGNVTAAYTSYYRGIILDPNVLTMNIYLINLYTTPIVLDDLGILDLLQDYINPKILVYKYVNVTNEQMLGEPVDIENKVSAALVQNQEYQILIKSDNKADKIIGSYVATSSGQKLIRLYDIFLSQADTGVPSGVTYARYVTNISNYAAIGVNYNDSGSQTDRVQIIIRDYITHNILVDEYVTNSQNFQYSTTNNNTLNNRSLIVSLIPTYNGVEVTTIPDITLSTYFNNYTTIVNDFKTTTDEIFGTQALDWFITVLISLIALGFTVPTGNFGSLVIIGIGFLLKVMGLYSLGWAVMILGLIFTAILFAKKESETR